MRIVAALGGNALVRRGQPMTAAVQRANAQKAARALATLIEAGHQLIITHGNGPQVGLLALQAEAGPKDGAYAFDLLGAESEGLIGYMLEQELRNSLSASAQTATLLTQIRVDGADPAFGSPSKPIGPVYEETVARGLAAEKGWTIASDGGKWRRVVPSPEPLEILEAGVVARLIDHGVTVICAGGGGIPVTRQADGKLVGLEAVIDKDRASALLAIALKADRLVLLTDVKAVFRNFGAPNAEAIVSAGVAWFDTQRFAAGSMAPKVEAAVRFARATGGTAAIGALDDAAALIAGTSGTLVLPGEAAVRVRPVGAG